MLYALAKVKSWPIYLLSAAECCCPSWQVQKELGLVFHPIEETYIDMAVTLIQKGILKPKSA